MGVTFTNVQIIYARIISNSLGISFSLSALHDIYKTGLLVNKSPKCPWIYIAGSEGRKERGGVTGQWETNNPSAYVYSSLLWHAIKTQNLPLRHESPRHFFSPLPPYAFILSLRLCDVVRSAVILHS